MWMRARRAGGIGSLFQEISAEIQQSEMRARIMELAVACLSRVRARCWRASLTREGCDKRGLGNILSAWCS